MILGVGLGEPASFLWSSQYGPVPGAKLITGG